MEQNYSDDSENEADDVNEESKIISIDVVEEIDDSAVDMNQESTAVDVADAPSKTCKCTYSTNMSKRRIFD